MLAGLVCVAAGYVGWRYLDARAPLQPIAAPAPVHVAMVERRDVPVVLNGLGTVQATNTVTVRSRVDGQIEKVAFEEGQIVHQGDLLVQIDRAPFQAALDQATAKLAQDQAMLKNAQLNFDRTSILAKKGDATQQTLDQQTANVAQLAAQIQGDQAAIESARVQLAYTTISSPLTGRVGFRLVDPGNIVHASDQTGIVTITQLDPISVIFTAPEEQLPAISDGLKSGRFRLRRCPRTANGYWRTERWHSCDNQVDAASGTIRLKASFANANGALWPGLSVSTRLRIDTLKNTVAVPDRRCNAVLAACLRSWSRQTARRSCAISRSAPSRTVGLSSPADWSRESASSRRGIIAWSPARPLPSSMTMATPDQKGGSVVNFSAPFIRYPVATSLIMLGILFIGLMAYPNLPVAPLPKVDFPTIQVTAQLPGASPETMASSVAQPLERQFAQIPGVAQTTSSSALGITNVVVQFDLDRNIDAAANDIQSAINAAAGQLPRDLPSPPTYRKVNPADSPILLLSVTSDTMPLTELDDNADIKLAQQISQIAGVGQVTIGGEQKPAIRIQIDPAKLVAKNLSLEDVRAQLSVMTVNSPKGNIDGERRSYTIYANDQLTAAKDWNDVIIAYRNGAPLRVRDIGQAIAGPEDAKKAAWASGKRGVFLVVFKQPGANVIDTVDRIKAELPRLRAAMPPAIRVDVLSDRTQTIRASVNDVQFTLLLSIACVVGVIFLFLRTFWATAIPSITVPLSSWGHWA